MHILIIQFVLTIGCASGQQKNAENKMTPTIIYNGDKLLIDEVNTNDFIRNIDHLFNGCDDLYELIVTEEVIESVKSERQYAEILFPEKRIIEAGKFKKMEFDRILIPLSGKFHSSGQVTFFTGVKDYSNTPVMNSKGSIPLEEALNKISK